MWRDRVGIYKPCSGADCQGHVEIDTHAHHSVFHTDKAGRFPEGVHVLAARQQSRVDRTDNVEIVNVCGPLSTRLEANVTA